MSEDTIWSANLDDKYVCAVTRLDESRGRLTVKDGERTLLDEVVGLAYGAMFGPDIDDVLDWQDKCVAAVDGA